MLSRPLALALFAVSSLPACVANVDAEIAAGASGDGPIDAGADAAEQPPPLPDPGVRLAQGLKPKCIKSAEGTVTCWDYYAGDPDLPDPVELEGIDDATAVVQFLEQGCVLHATGRVSCFGWSHHGQLGLAVEMGGTSVVPVVLPEVELVKLTSGHHAVCGIEPSGQAVCWGGAYGGPLGDPSVTESRSPVDVIGVTDAIDISASFGEVCAAHAAGTVTCWRDHEMPFDVAGVEHASQIAVGEYQVCAVVDQGAMVCWGDDGAPAAVPDLHDVAQISAGYTYGCLRRATGEVKCWRPGATSNVDLETVGVDDAIDVTAISNIEGGCAVRSSGEVMCWKPGEIPAPFP